MKSFRTEIENPVVEHDILELERKIREFHQGTIDEERFRTLRLARGVYGQRQAGVQMIRIKIPYGKLTAQQLERIADVSDEYSTGKLHITTRQDIQIHHVSLERTPELWAELERDEITIREACGNTVRNITASSTSGIAPDEVFDVRPYAHAVFSYFLRKPVCQEMGRKIKFSFSNNEQDTARGFMHDLGFIAAIKDGKHGFKVLVGGGLGSQSRQADVLYNFLPSEKIIPLTEAVLRVFERLGERSNRMKARLKFLIKGIGLDAFKDELEIELSSLPEQEIPIVYSEETPTPPRYNSVLKLNASDKERFEFWKENVVFQQKQKELFAIGVKVQLGDFTTDQARKLAEDVRRYTGDELTLTIDQNILIRHVPESQLVRFFYLLETLNLSTPGYEQFVDITSCPGTDTCNLGIANSTSLSKELESVLENEFPQYSHSTSLSIKISGCMNSCGQHMIANIGFQGMSIRAKDKRVLPAVQILLGGGQATNGEWRFADKVIKVPSKRSLEALRILLNTFEKSEHEDFLTFYDTNGEKFFYDLLKPLTDLETLGNQDFIDWGQSENYTKEIGVGECAGVVIDLVSTLFKESEEKLENARVALLEKLYSDSLYHTYSAIVNTAKALLLSAKKRTNSHQSIIDSFQTEFIDSGKIDLDISFQELALSYSQQQPSLELAKQQLLSAHTFYNAALHYRHKELNTEEHV